MNWKLIAFACAMSATVALAADEIAEKLSSAGAQVTRGEGLYRCQVHRGGGRDTRPDNSLETFLWCWGHGVAPEADARLTKDGVAGGGCAADEGRCRNRVSRFDASAHWARHFRGTEVPRDQGHDVERDKGRRCRLIFGRHVCRDFELLPELRR